MGYVAGAFLRPKSWLVCIAGAAVLILFWIWFGIRLMMQPLEAQVGEVEHALASFPEFVPNRNPSMALFAATWQRLEQARELVHQRSLELKEERAELASVLDAMRDWVISVDADSRVLWANEPMRLAMNNMLRPGQALATVIRTPEVLPMVQEAMLGNAVPELRVTGITPGHTFSVHIAPSVGGGAVMVLRDQTRSEQVERTLREFVANVSHELRTPLTSIGGYVETIMDNEPLSPMGKDFLVIVSKNVERMTRLTEDLLALARIESGENPMRIQPHAASQLVRDAVASIAGVVQESGAEVKVDPIPSVEVLADSDTITQVIGNLVENALRYGVPPDGSRTRVQITSELQEGYVQFRVRDWGRGIASEHLKRIFERFYRVDAARSRETGGTGLGLAIAKHIVEEHGGTILAESALGQGTTMSFTLPLAHPEQKEQAAS